MQRQDNGDGHGKSRDHREKNSGHIRQYRHSCVFRPSRRSNSLIARDTTLPDTLTVTARTDTGEIMGVRHVSLPIEGVQFHPESVLTPEGEAPPGTPFELPEYAPAEEAEVERLNAEADEFAAISAEANQTGDNFVLIAVIMATVLFFAGVGTKFRGRGVRLLMLTLAALLFLGGSAMMLSLPQNVGI